MKEFLIPAVCAVVFLLVGILIGNLLRKKIAEAKIGSAEAEAKRIVEDGKRDAEDIRKEAESRKKEALIEAKEEILQSRNEADREIKERRKEVAGMERRLTQKEENLDKKMESLEKKNEQLDRKIRENEAEREKIGILLTKEQQRLEEISGYSVEQAKTELIERVEAEIKDELAKKMIELEDQFKEEADTKARNIISVSYTHLRAHET